MTGATIPFTFDPSSTHYETDHLTYQDVEGGQSVSWPAAGLTLHVPEHKWHPSFEDLEKANGGLFKMHGLSGFSLGAYHEFLVCQLPTHMAFKMGGIEVSFGEPTPLAAYIFWPVYREKYFGPWDELVSARIVGASEDEFEIAFINACLHYKELTGTLPVPQAMDLDLLPEWDDEAPDPEVHVKPPPVRDVEPLRFYYNGLSQADDVAACIYFFRVLEYYSFLTNQKQLTKLRHDPTLGEQEFAKRTLELITKEEKGPLLKLVNQLSDEPILKQALDGGVVKDKNPAQLGEAIYVFRNSIVHGKYSYGYTIHSCPVVGEDAALPVRREILRKLARKAIDNFGSKLI